MLWRRRAGPASGPDTGRDVGADVPRPLLAASLAVIGDVHGRDDLLETLLSRLAALPDAAQMRVICVGDMVDRGPDSAAVLRRLHALETRPAPFASLTCLMGNHDRMLLDFIQDPAGTGMRWLQYGGAETLLSFGLSSDRMDRSEGDAAHRLVTLAQGLAGAMGPELHDWLAARPLYWTEASLWVTHAGADPRHSPAVQGAREFLWGGPRFYDTPRLDGLWVAHGHKIVQTPVLEPGRIAVDTGAWRTGRLTAAVIQGEGDVVFHTT